MKKRQKHDENEDFFTIIDNENSFSNIKAPHTLTPEEVLFQEDAKPKTYNSHKALDALKKRMSGAIETVKEEADISQKIKVALEKQSEETDEFSYNDKIDAAAQNDTVYENETEQTGEAGGKISLLDKCLPYLIEEDGTETNLNKEPLYKLQSVAEILKSDSEKIMERLSEKYEISFDNLGKPTDYESLINSARKEESAKAEPEDVPKTETIVKPDPDIDETPKEPEHVTSFVDKIVISDIDTPSALAEKPKNDRIHNTATITFTPIDGKKGEKKLNISTFTRPVDLTGEFANLPGNYSAENNDEVKLEENEFDEFVPKDEITTEKDGRRILRKYSLNKRKSFISSFIGTIITLLLCLNWVPFLRKIILENTTVWMCIFAGLALIPILLNINCFKSLKNIFSHDSSPDISLCLSAITVTLYSIFGIINKESVADMLVFLSVAFTFRAIGEFMKSSYMVTNLKIAMSKNKKETLKLINDSAITYTLTENSTDGEALIAATQPSDEISDFMKYSTHSSFIDGKLPFITATSIILSVITGIVCAFYFDGIVYGFYSAAVIQCLTAIPVSFLIDNLPLYKASKKLGVDGAMILGKTGAEMTEMANVAVMNANKLFPNGTITLHQMQALSANNLEDTIVRAASLTECLGSPLAPIFKTIAGTGNITTLPDSDTVK